MSVEDKIESPHLPPMCFSFVVFMYYFTAIISKNCIKAINYILQVKLRQEVMVVVEPKEDSRVARVGSRVAREDSRGPWQTHRRMMYPELGILHMLEPSLLVLHCLP